MKLTPILLGAAIGIPALLLAEDRQPWTVKTDTGSLILRRVDQGPPPALPREKKRESLRERLLGSGNDRPAAAEPKRYVDPSAPPPGQQWQYQARMDDARGGRTTRSQAQRRSRVVEEEVEQEKGPSRLGGLMQRLRDSAPSIEDIPDLPLVSGSGEQESVQDEVHVIPQGVAAADAINPKLESRTVPASVDTLEPPAAIEPEEPGRLRSWINRRVSLRAPEPKPEPAGPTVVERPRPTSTEIVVEVVPLGASNPGGNSTEVIVEVGPPEENIAPPVEEPRESGLLEQLRRGELRALR
ncbi:MAG: hypothetical protein AAF585_14475 [Verrucomicrobiota bacterium]